MREHAVVIAHEEREQIELLGRKPNLLAAPKNAATVVVNRQIAVLDTSGGRVVVVAEDAPEGDANTRQELFGGKRLGDVVVGTDVERGHLGAVAAAGR